MIDIKINPESIERFRDAVKATRGLRFGDVTIPVFTDDLMSPGMFGIAALSPWLQEYWETQRRAELLLHVACMLTGETPAALKARAAQSIMPIDMYLLELIHDSTEAHQAIRKGDQL